MYVCLCIYVFAITMLFYVKFNDPLEFKMNGQCNNQGFVFKLLE